MNTNDERAATPADVDKTVEVARLHFRVQTSATVVDGDGPRMLNVPSPFRPSAAEPPHQAQGLVNAADVEVPLADALNGVVSDLGRGGLAVVQVRVEPAGSLEFVAVVVAAYSAVRIAVEVLENLE